MTKIFLGFGVTSKFKAVLESFYQILLKEAKLLNKLLSTQRDIVTQLIHTVKEPNLEHPKKLFKNGLYSIDNNFCMLKQFFFFIGK